MADNEGRQNRHNQKRGHCGNRHLPHRPKKPLSAYTAFVKAYFKTNRARNSTEARDGIRAASAIWNKKSAKEKSAFATGTAKERATYQKEMAKWRAQKNLLKRPASSYALFLQSTWEAEADSGRNVVEMSKHASELWRRMTDAQKNVYRQQHLGMADNYYDIMERLDSGDLDIGTVTVRSSSILPQARARRREGIQDDESDEEEEEVEEVEEVEDVGEELEDEEEEMEMEE